MSQTIELLPQGAHDPIAQKIDRAIGAILRLFQAAHPVVIAYSGGKDSSVVAALVLHAALLHAALLHRAAGGDDLAPAAEWTGMRDPFIEAMTAESPCEPEIMVKAGGRTLWRLPTEQSFSVDFEAVCMLQDFELDRMLETHDMGVQPGQITAGYRWYLQYGCLTLSRAQQTEHDEVCRRTAAARGPHCMEPRGNRSGGTAVCRLTNPATQRPRHLVAGSFFFVRPAWAHSCG